MMRKARITVAIIAACIGLAACSGKTKSKDNVAVPKELTEIQASVDFERVWSTSIDTNKTKRGEHFAPSASGEMAYVVGSNEVRAIQIASGKTIWTQKSEKRLAAAPGADGKRVIVGTLDGEVLAFDAQDGEMLWEAQLSSELLAAPTLTEELVILCGNDGRIAALNLSSGKLAWQVDRDVPLLSLRGTGSAVVEGDTAFVPGDDGKVTALNIADGAVRWEQAVNISSGRNELERIADIDGGSVVISGDLFVAGYNGQTSAVASNTGSTLWTFQGPSVVGLSVDNRRVFVSNSKSEIIALDRRSGAQLWKQDALLNRFVTKPALVDEKYVVVGDLEGYLHALDIESGELVGRTKLAKLGFPGAPLVVGDVLIAQNATGAIAAFRLK